MITSALRHLIHTKLDALMRAQPYHELALTLVGCGITEGELNDLFKEHEFRSIPQPTKILLANAFRDLTHKHKE